MSHVRARIAAVVIQSEGGSGGGLEREEGWRVERRWRAALGEDGKVRDVGSEGENERRSDRPRTSTNY